MLIVNKRGTTRNIEPSQLAEYKRRGYTEVVAKATGNRPSKSNSNDGKENK